MYVFILVKKYIKGNTKIFLITFIPFFPNYFCNFFMTDYKNTKGAENKFVFFLYNFKTNLFVLYKLQQQ